MYVYICVYLYVCIYTVVSQQPQSNVVLKKHSTPRVNPPNPTSHSLSLSLSLSPSIIHLLLLLPLLPTQLGWGVQRKHQNSLPPTSPTHHNLSLARDDPTILACQLASSLVRKCPAKMGPFVQTTDEGDRT